MGGQDDGLAGDLFLGEGGFVRMRMKGVYIS